MLGFSAISEAPISALAVPTVGPINQLQRRVCGVMEPVFEYVW